MVDRILVYEPKAHPPIPSHRFVRRLLLHAAAALGLLVASLLLGMAGLMLAPIVHRVMHKFHWAQDR